MDTEQNRSIVISLKEAKDLYKAKGIYAKLALKAYSEEELTDPWMNITSFKDACEKLGIVTPVKSPTKHSEAIYKLDIIREALNGDWVPDLESGIVWYPVFRLSRSSNLSAAYERLASFTFSGERYYLYYTECHTSNPGLSGMSLRGEGYIVGITCLFACKSYEIAHHFAKYFYKEIFDSLFIQYNMHKWDSRMLIG